MDLDPRSLLVFRHVGRTGSLAAAARVLGWTQPAVAQHVRRLERTTGVPLVVRRGRASALTDAGLVLLDHAERVHAQLDEAREDLDRVAGARTGRVRIAAFPTASATFVVAALQASLAAAPEVEHHLTELEPEPALEALRRG